jgi:hypothetical protein
VSASLEPAAALSPRSSLAPAQLSSPEGISSPLTLLPPMTDLETDNHSSTPSFYLHPVFDFNLDNYLLDPQMPLVSSPEPPQTPIHHIVHQHTNFFSPLPSLPVDTSVRTPHLEGLATHLVAPVSLHPNPIPPASQPPFLSQPTCNFICATTITTMTSSSHILGPAAMPHPLTNAVPFFSGSLDDPINDFLAEYSELANGHGLSEQ